MQRSIGRYVVEGPLGAGGMGSVLRGRDPDPNIVNAFEVGTERDRDQAFVAMELVQAGPGPARGARAGDRGDFTPSNVLVGDDGRARVLGFGLATLDEVVVERGRSTSVDWPAGTAPTRHDRDDADARRLEGSRASEGVGNGLASGSWVPFEARPGELTADDTVLGTPAYMAPEQHTGAPVAAATDQLGAP